MKAQHSAVTRIVAACPGKTVIQPPPGKEPKGAAPIFEDQSAVGGDAAVQALVSRPSHE